MNTKRKQPAAVVCHDGKRCKGTHPLICETHGCSFAVGRAAAVESRDAREERGTRSQQRVGRPLYVGSIKDYRDKGGVRGGIYDLSKPQKHQLVLVVYGRTLKEMRGRKQLLLKALKEEERPTDKAERLT